jgi:hypothetical protein
LLFLHEIVETIPCRRRGVATTVLALWSTLTYIHLWNLHDLIIRDDFSRSRRAGSPFAILLAATA